MNIGIVIAVIDEFKTFLSSGFTLEKEIISNREIYKTKIGNNNIYVLNSGCGIIYASSATEFLISSLGCDYLLNYGVSGALDKSLKVEDLFILTHTIHYDYDVSNLDDVLKHQYSGYNSALIGGSIKLYDLVKKIEPSVKDAVCASGDKFVSIKEEKERLHSLGASICDMESAGIFLVSNFHKKEVLSIKCISDTFDGDSKDYYLNVERSSKKAFEIIKKLLLSI